jgi:hypothetical protein
MRRNANFVSLSISSPYDDEADPRPLPEPARSSSHLFCDEPRCPVLDPGRGKIKTGFLWAIARDDRAWGGSDPPAVVYSYAPGRGGTHAVKLLDGFVGSESRPHRFLRTRAASNV